jgi:hypothetical protein
MLLTYGAFGFGALCMLLGFFIGTRSGETAEGGTTVKMFGIEFSATNLGRGLMFSAFGLVLVLVAVLVQPKFPAAGAAATAAAPSSQASPQPAPATAARRAFARAYEPEPAAAPAYGSEPEPTTSAYPRRRAAPPIAAGDDESDARAILRSIGRDSPPPQR